MSVQVRSAEGGPDEGETYPFLLHYGGATVELVGRVRWTRHNKKGTIGDDALVFDAGIDFEQILSPEPGGIWARLEAAH